MKKVIEIQFETNRKDYEENREAAINDYFKECLDGTETDEFVDTDEKVYTGFCVNNYMVYTYLKFDSEDVLDPEHLVKVSDMVDFD